MRKSFWATTIPSLLYPLYLAVALPCLVHWGSPGTWSRLGVFSGGDLGSRID